MSNEEKRARLLEAAAALLDEADQQQLNIVSLNKALFYLDLASLRDLGETFTKNSYVALDQGPVIAKYQERLIAPLEKEGIAIRSRLGLATPITLVKLPEFKRITVDLRSLIKPISRWCSERSSTKLSKYSHDNPGWIVAFKDQSHANGQKQIINMYIAMQQIVEDDPWTREPQAKVSRKACEAADSSEGQPW